MGKFSEAIGILKLNIGGVVQELRPKMGDNQRLASVMTGYQKHRDQARMLKEIGTFVYELIVREDTTLIDEDKEELKLAIELNQMAIMEEVMVAFRWTTKEDMDKAKAQSGDELKNLMKQA